MSFWRQRLGELPLHLESTVICSYTYLHFVLLCRAIWLFAAATAVCTSNPKPFKSCFGVPTPQKYRCRCCGPATIVFGPAKIGCEFLRHACFHAPSVSTKAEDHTLNIDSKSTLSPENARHINTSGRPTDQNARSLSSPETRHGAPQAERCR